MVGKVGRWLTGAASARRVFLAALLAILSLAPTSPPAQAEYDRSKFCKADADTVVILVDVTSAFDDSAKDLFQRGISAIAKALNPGEQIYISTIEDSYTNSKLLYHGCVPYCASGGVLDWLTSECTDGLIRLETARQENDIRAGLQSRLKNTADLNTSDILRSVYYLTAQRPKDAHLDLYIFSDLIENSDLMPGKMFWSQPTPKSLAMLKTDSLMPDLSNTTVKVFGVGRGGSLGRHPLSQDHLNKLHQFWSAYFAAAGAPDAQISEALYLESQN